jgi:hypothetical protein
VTLLGGVRVERAYYHCRHCRAGHCPRDGRLGLSAADLSPGAEQAVTLAGTLGVSFAEAAEKVLPRLAGLRLAESTVERATERVGAELGRRLAAGEAFGPDRDWAWQRDATGASCAYVSADLTGVGMQGEGGRAAEGRMAAVAMVYNPGVAGQARYVAGLSGGLAALGGPLRRQAAQVGMDRAQRWVAVSDGGAGIEDWLAANFPRVEAVVLDFYHAAEHLGDWAKTLHPADPDAASALTQEWCHRLKHEGGAAVLAALREAEVGRRPAAREAQRQLLGYFENQVHRMDYPYYRRMGWQIGSGPVEAACKQVVNQRLKGSGMRWGEAGADAVCHLRALFRGEASQWDAFWASLVA